jgi:ParB-like chromosome segregation protein Spo0J
MITKEFITVKLDELHPYENNPRINDNAVSHVKASIEQCENLDPIEIDENGVILSGHTRLLALQELGYTETEVVRISGLDEDQKRKYRILANKTNEIADWDFDKLAEELDGLDFDGFDFGFDSDFSQYENATQAINQGCEVDLENFNDDKFECECPKCGFKFNRK